MSRQGLLAAIVLPVPERTINLQYCNFDYLKGDKGIDIQASSTVTSLDYLKFDNLVGTAATDDAFITVAIDCDRVSGKNNYRGPN